MINLPLAREKWISSFLISQQQCSNYPSPASTAITTAPASAPFAASSHSFSRGNLKTCNTEILFFFVNPESRWRLENQRKELILLINQIENEKGSKNGTEEQPQGWSGTWTSLRTTASGYFHARSVLGASHHLNLRKCPFPSVKLFLAWTPTFQDSYKQPECSCEHSCTDLSGRKNSCSRSAFYSAAFQAGKRYNRQCTFWEGACIFRGSCKLWNSNKKKRSEVELSDKKIW